MLLVSLYTRKKVRSAQHIFGCCNILLFSLLYDLDQDWCLYTKTKLSIDFKSLDLKPNKQKRTSTLTSYNPPCSRFDHHERNTFAVHLMLLSTRNILNKIHAMRVQILPINIDQKWDLHTLCNTYIPTVLGWSIWMDTDDDRRKKKQIEIEKTKQN